MMCKCGRECSGLSFAPKHQDWEYGTPRSPYLVYEVCEHDVVTVDNRRKAPDLVTDDAVPWNDTETAKEIRAAKTPEKVAEAYRERDATPDLATGGILEPTNPEATIAEGPQPWRPGKGRRER